MQELVELARWARRICLLVLIDLIASGVEIDFLGWNELPRTATTDGPDLVSDIQHQKNWGTEVSKEKAIHRPITVGKDDPSVSLRQNESLVCVNFGLCGRLTR